MIISKFEDLQRICNEKNKKIYEVILEYEAISQGAEKEEIIDHMKKSLEVMKESSKYALYNETKGKIIGGESQKLKAQIDAGESIVGQPIANGIMYAFSTMEVNVSMGRIVAAPTAGSCGVIPGVFISLQEKYNLSDEKLIEGLLTASAIGMIIGKNATLSGAEGGCQAEIGSASAMASAAIVEMLSGTVDQCLDAAAICIKNILGLVCDPVAGLVESPCLKRNAMGVANAYVSSEIAIAGIKSIIPLDQVIKSMYDIGQHMPCSLRETAEGGVAITKKGIEIANRIFGK